MNNILNMKFKLNNAPHLRMHEITKKLFNLNFLSDIQFLVDNKIIYAHSLELMKRSVVFENDLINTFNEKKIIPITDCKYEVFLEFIRFIYTDECKIDDDNGIELLKLAIKYRILMLENLVINSLSTTKFSLKLFNHCIIDKYDFARHRSTERFRFNYEEYLKNPQFLSLHWDSVKVALQLDPIITDVTEFQIFEAFGKWIINYSKANQMSVTELQERFNDLIKHIRFPLMSGDEIRNCVKKYPGLLTDTDCMSISKQIVFGSDGVNDLWLSKQRSEFIFPCDWRLFDHNTVFKTRFTLAKNMILCGLWIGMESYKRKIEIEITERGSQTELIILSAPTYWNMMGISLGDSIHLRPGFVYTIYIRYLNITEKKFKVICRNDNVDVKFNDPKNCIKILEAGENMVEMLFKSPDIVNR